MEKVHRTLLDGRISDIPGATERIVDDRIFIEQYDVEGAPTVEEIMGEGWGRHDDEPDPGTPDAPDEVVDGKELERSRSRSHQPIVLVRDTHPVHEGYAKAKLTTAGPGGYARRAEKIESVTPRVEDGESEEAAQAGRLEEQSNKSFVRVANAAATMANGGNSLIHRAAVNHSMGYYRVLGPNPCSFCLALAAQGVIYGADAYYDTNQRFTGQGTAKVHDGCQCSLEPVSMVDGTEALPPGVAEARDMWNSLRGQMAGMNSQERLAYFRRVVKDGKIDERAVLKEERPELRERREELWVTIPGLMVQLSFWKKWKEDHPQTTEAAEHAESMLREQLEMRLQQWDRYAFPETDWTAEYDFMLGRAASIYDDQTYAGYVVRGDTPRAAAMERRGEVETTQFTYEFATWLREQKPDAHELHEKYWPEQITAETFK